MTQSRAMSVGRQRCRAVLCEAARVVWAASRGRCRGTAQPLEKWNSFEVQAMDQLRTGVGGWRGRAREGAAQAQISDSLAEGKLLARSGDWLRIQNPGPHEV